MSIFTHYVWFIPFDLIFSNLFETFQSGIHRRIYICHFCLKISLVMNQSGIIQLTDCFCCTTEIASECGFISHRPHNNRWMISVSLYHTDTTVYISIFPCLIICDPCIIFYPFKSMAFQICFIDHIKSIFVTQIIKIFICRIMRAANSIDIVLFHQTNICFHLLSCHSSSFFWIIIMMIDSVQKDYLIIDTEVLIFDLDFAESTSDCYFLIFCHYCKFI